MTAPTPVAVNPLRTDWQEHVRDHVTRAEAAATDAQALAMLRPLFDNIGWLGALAAHVTGALTADRMHLFGLTALSNGPLRQLLLWSGERVSLSIAILTSRAWHPATPPARYAFGGSLSLLRVLTDRPVAGRMASAPMFNEPCADWDYSIAPGEVLALDEARHALALLPGETETPFLRARIRRLPAPLAISGIPGERLPYRLANGDDALARSLAIVELLRTLGARPPIDSLRALLPRASDAQRWTVMREMLTTDTEAAWPDLEAMAASDPHDDVRAAAAALIERLHQSGRSAQPCPA